MIQFVIHEQDSGFDLMNSHSPGSYIVFYEIAVRFDHLFLQTKITLDNVLFTHKVLKQTKHSRGKRSYFSEWFELWQKCSDFQQ